MIGELMTKSNCNAINDLWILMIYGLIDELIIDNQWFLMLVDDWWIDW
jgi:hypothetical protein